jgi:AcrR family transcriptional regulator
MATGKRSRLTLDERRAQLVALGADIFRDRPYADVSVDDIAAAAGVSKGLLYHYFPSKRDFYVAVLRQAAQEMEALTELDPGLPAERRLREGLDRYLDYVEQHAAGYASVLRAGPGVDPEVEAIIDGVRARMAGRVLDGLPAARPEPSPALLLAVRGWVAFAEAASLEWAERGGVSRAELRDMLAAMLAAALRTAGAWPGAAAPAP